MQAGAEIFRFLEDGKPGEMGHQISKIFRMLKENP
jgi:hypothetical protein